MQDFRQLAVWHKAHACFLAVHRTLAARPDTATFGLRAQALRAAASVTANIAEGCGRRSTREYIRHLDIAKGSARELENHLIVARDLHILAHAQCELLIGQLAEVQRMLSGLARSLSQQVPRVAARSR